jgi:hypothetical protein
MKYLAVDDIAFPFIMNGADATVHRIRREGETPICLICIDGDVLLTRKQTEVYGLLVHECVHVLQYLKKEINDPDMSDECEAYYTQNIAQFCFVMCERFIEHAKKPKKKKGKK